MREERKLLIQLMSYVNLGHLKIAESDGSIEETLFEVQELLAQSEQEQLSEAFRSGMLYSAKKYAATGSERFTGNDIAMFLEMESCELSDDDIVAILEPNDDYIVIEKDKTGSTFNDVADMLQASTLDFDTKNELIGFLNGAFQCIYNITNTDNFANTEQARLNNSSDFWHQGYDAILTIYFKNIFCIPDKHVGLNNENTV